MLINDNSTSVHENTRMRMAPLACILNCYCKELRDNNQSSQWLPGSSWECDLGALALDSAYNWGTFQQDQNLKKKKTPNRIGKKKEKHLWHLSRIHRMMFCLLFQHPPRMCLQDVTSCSPITSVSKRFQDWNGQLASWKRDTSTWPL